MKWLIDLVKTIGDLPNTFWGITILFSSMYIAVKYNSSIGYYFAGVGSTLLGIKHLDPTNTTATFTSDPPQLKVQTDASNQTSKD